MAKYFYDTEFLEGEQTRYSWFGFKVSTWYKMIGLTLIGFGAFMVGLIGCKDPDALMCFATYLFASVFFFTLNYDRIPPTIDLISIGIAADDGREYYAVSKEFNLCEAWNRKWIRENVLLPLWRDLLIRSDEEWYAYSHEMALIDFEDSVLNGGSDKYFNYKSLENLISKYGKYRKDISQEIIEFCNPITDVEDDKIELYGYYADYDHVVFCWLFGKMIDLPHGFPMYTVDLKQILDEKANDLANRICYESGNHTVWDLNKAIQELKLHPDYPVQQNEHLAISDARWILQLYLFLDKR